MVFLKKNQKQSNISKYHLIQGKKYYLEILNVTIILVIISKRNVLLCVVQWITRPSAVSGPPLSLSSLSHLLLHYVGWWINLCS